jgi:AraC family transcriptional activator of pobA
MGLIYLPPQNAFSASTPGKALVTPRKKANRISLVLLTSILLFATVVICFMHMHTLASFYTTKLRLALPASLRSGGHLAVFRLEDFATNPAQPSADYSRKDFYKVMLGTGHATYHYADKGCLLEPSQSALVFTNPQVPHGWEVHTGLYSGYCCVFTEDFWPAHTHLRPADLAVFRPGGPSFLRLTPAQALAFGSLFEKMLAEQSSAYPHKYELLFYYLMECVHEAQKLAPAPTGPGLAAADRLTAAFLDLLARQFPIMSPTQRLELRTAQAFASYLAVHVNYLNRRLKAATGKTTSQLLAERLVQEARALLLHTDWPIADISYCLGFEEATYFTQFFRRHTQGTPSQVRQV